MSGVERGNEAARRVAQENGQLTYRHDVVETWPGCSTCGYPIRCNVDPPAGVRPVGSFRACQCPGVVWRMGPAGGPWEKLPD